MKDHKALDRAEIIAALGCCGPYPANRDCGNCPVARRDTWCCSKVLASAATLLKRDAEPNDPLTLEELRKMTGEPVYIQRLQDIDGFWIVICASACDKLTTDYGGYFEFADYGKTWLAYRRKPDGGGE